MEQFVFHLQIVNGYVFKNLLTIIKSETEKASMLLSLNNIEISFVNNNSTGLHIINMNPNENIGWIFNPTDSNDNLLENHSIGFNTIEAFNAIKKIGINDSIRLFLIKGENTLMFQPLRSSSKDMGHLTILKIGIFESEYTKYEVVDSDYNEMPTIKITTKCFSELCSEVSNVKCDYINIEGDGESVTFR